MASNIQARDGIWDSDKGEKFRISDSSVIARRRTQYDPLFVDLQVISKPKNVNLLEMAEKDIYYTYSEAGKGVKMYIMDGGCYLGHSAFDKLKREDVEWLFAGPIESDEKTDDDAPSNDMWDYYTGIQEEYHGTRVASKAVGSVGVANGASLVVVKLQ
ncbi:hypothetical protein ABW20_dc0106293 [Dactylellina cionopaga]|nr:hypothetical protein ABW20_dc0106293 [Dactylellina cionopaga]